MSKNLNIKKIIASILAVSVCATAFGVGCGVSATETTIKGDANGDGKVGISDLVMTAGYLSGKTYSDMNFENADYNGDGRINIFDLVMLKQVFINGEATSDTTYITLGDTITVNGSGATVNGSIVTITDAGRYSISGTLTDGQLIVNAEDTDAVNIILNGIDITCSTTSPIYVENAGSVTMNLASGTTNTVTDGTAYVYPDTATTEPDATIFSSDALTITGDGSLTINANYGDGLTCKDDLIINSGTLDITSVDDGIKGKDSVTINNGNIKINADGDGIKSTKGYVNIKGGTVKAEAKADGLQAETASTISGGTVQLYSQNGITVTGGYSVTGGTVYATSTVGAIATPTAGSLNTMSLNFAEQQVKKTTVAIVGIGEFKPTMKYQYTMVSSADIKNGTTYSATLEGSQLKHDGSATGAFTATGTNTSFTGVALIDSSAVITTGNTITLKNSSIDFTGTGATVSGSTVTITEPGDYDVYGTLDDGQIIVNVDKTTYVDATVNLIFHNASITSSNNSAIYVESIDDKCTVETADGTTNYVTDGSGYTNADADSGAIYSKDDLNLKGTGTLIVTGNTADAVVSKDDLKVKSGTIQIKSVDDGLRGKDSVTVEDGNITINSGADGIKATNATDTTQGYITILGGTFDINATTDGIQAETKVDISGGTFDIYTSKGSGSVSTGSGSTTTTTESAKGIKGLTAVNITGGTFTIDSADDAIHSNTDVTIANAKMTIASGDDGIHSDVNTNITSGDVNITKSYEGIEGYNINVNGGTIHLVSSDDGFNVAGGNDSSGTTSPGGFPQGGGGMDSSNGGMLAITDGYVYVNAGGDGLDSNGDMTISGGLVIVNGPTDGGNGYMDVNGTYAQNGGTVIGVGSSGMLVTPTSGSSSENSIVATGLSAGEGTMVVVTDSSNNVLMAYKLKKTIQAVQFSSALIKTGQTYNVYTGGTYTGTLSEDGYGTGGTYTGGTSIGSVTINSTVSTIGSTSGGGGFPGGRG